MLSNYIKIAWRYIIKNRAYSAINIIGLSTGIAFALLISAYIFSQLQVNNHLKHAGNQYIIQSKWKSPEEGYEIVTAGPLAKALKDNYPSLVANYYRFDGITTNVSKNNKYFREGIQMGDSTLLNMYGFTLKYGNTATALREPFTAIISQDKAIKYFGTTDVAGQTLTIENFSGQKHDFLITGVLNKYSKNSVTHLVGDFPNEIFISDANLDFFGRDMSWQNPSIASYIELQQGVSPKELEKPMAYIMKRDAPPLFASDLTPYLLPLKTYYLEQNNGLIKKMLYALSGIALFILIMAVINFINMSVSRSAARMKEIGVRKVLGGLKKQLIAQFITESVIIVLLATLFALIIFISTQNLLGSILNTAIPSLQSFPFYFVVFLLLFIFIVGFIAGIYPAFVLSSLKSVDSLKGKMAAPNESILLKKSLIAFQFATATIAFTGAILISKQVNLFLSKDVGYNKDYVISAQVPRDWSQAGVDKMITLRNQFKRLSSVKDASLSYEIPDGNNSGQSYIYKQGSDTAQAIPMQLLMSDENYLNLYQIPLVAGNRFMGGMADSANVLMNETAIKALGFKNAASAAGRQVRFLGDPTIYTISGITKDFHFGSMQHKVAPIIMFNVQLAGIYRFMSFRINPGNITAGINDIQKKWAELMPGAPFEYKFMDDTLANLYKSEIQLKKAAYAATILALIIVLLGIIGLVSLSIQKRTKEIGIRKVLGSSVAGIMLLFIKDFLLVILIGGLVACPLAYIIMQHWLQGYAYRVDITAQPFVISISSLGLITALLICIQTTKAAITNPVKSLRTE